MRKRGGFPLLALGDTCMGPQDQIKPRKLKFVQGGGVFIVWDCCLSEKSTSNMQHELINLQQYSFQQLMKLFHSKNYNSMMSLLEEKGFFMPGYKTFKLTSLTCAIQKKNAFQDFLEVVGDSKLNHFTLLKTVLVLITSVQVDPQVLSAPRIDGFVTKLHEKSQKILKKLDKPEKALMKSLSPNKLLSKVENIFNGKSTEKKQSESSKSRGNGSSYMVEHLILPLMGIFERIRANYEQVYRLSRPMDDDLCWASMNFLKKYLELSKSYEELGRYYYDQYAETACYVLSIIDFDIKNLYKRIVEYLKESIERVQTSIMEKQLQKLTEEEEDRIKQILMVVGEIDAMNDSIRLLYLGKYFARFFHANGLRSPPLFRGTQIVDFFDQIFRQSKKQKHKKERKGSYASSADTETTIEDRIHKFDVNKLIEEAFGEVEQVNKESARTYFSSANELY